MSSDARPSSADARLAALFPEPGSVQANPRRRRRRNAAIACVVVVVLALGIAAMDAAFGSSGTSYRTAAAGPHQVDTTLTGVATIEPISQATVAFPASGTVATVNVHVGDTVAAGGVLASLDAQSLQQTLHTKQASLAQAQLTLEKALSGQSVGSVSSGGSSNSSGSFGGSSSGSTGVATTSAVLRGTTTATAVLAASMTPASAPGGSPTSTDPALAAAQQAVLAAQQKVDADLQQANAAVAAVSTACAPFLGAPGTTTTTTTTPPDATACQAAITAAQQAQQTLAKDEQALADASSALDTLLNQRAATPPTTTTSPSSSPRTSSGTAASSASGGAGGGSGGGATTGGSGGSRTTSGSSPTAADLVAYQASVDAATYAVAAAQQAVDAATMTSPIDGTVVGVNLQAGDAVTANSSTKDIVVQGHGGFEIATSVSVDSLGSVAIGQPATVVPDGSHQALPGKVVSIGVVPASTTTTATLYHVIVGLQNPDASLHDGATGTVSIVTKQAHAALAVPTSAVTTTGGRHTVSVLRNGSPTVIAVQTGVMGNTWTEVTSGVKAGDEVILANVGAALPGSATASTGTSTGTPTRFGGFGGGGGAGGLGGFGGGGRG
jgi:HlyD family secretion protein